MGIAFLYTAALFAGAVEDFLTKDPIVTVDQIIATAMPHFRTPEMTLVFTTITLLGKSEIAALFFFIVVLLLWYRRRPIYILPLAVTVVGSAVFTYLGKLAFHRSRPETALYVEQTSSFPSGHAVIAVALYGFAAFLLMHFSKSFRVKLNVFFGTAILIILIGFSRLYLCEHYLSDVNSGYLLGTLWLIIGIALTYWLESKTDRPHTTSPSAKLLSAIAATLFLFFFAGFSQLFHYRQALPVAKKAYPATSAEELFTDKSRRYTQSLIGLDAWPVNLIVAADSQIRLSEAFFKAGWHRAGTKVIQLLPIFWSGEHALLSFEKTEKKQRYFVKIYQTDALLQGKKPLFVAVTGAIEHFTWGIVPKFIPDVDVAREFAAESLRRNGFVLNEHILALQKPLIATDIMDNAYFTDGNAVIIKLTSRSANAHSHR